MRRHHSVLPLLLPALMACGGSGGDDDDDDGMLPAHPQCNSAAYVAFDPANHAGQELRVAAYDDMLALMLEAANDPSAAEAKVGEAQMLYENRADLRAEVMGRIDPHFDGAAGMIGPALDGAIMEGFAEGRTATTALALHLARQKVDKTLVHFFYVSVFYEMTRGARESWDGALGYYNGGSTANDEGARRGLASVATERDGANNTNLAETIFNGLVDGSCELAHALEEAGGEEIDFQTVPAVKSLVEQVDLDIQKVLAFSAGHEAFEMVALQGDLSTARAQEEMWIKLAGLDPSFKAVEPHMDSQTAGRIRAAIDGAWADPSGAWMATFPAQMILEDLAAAYGIDIRG